MKNKFIYIGAAACCAAILAPIQPARAQADSALLDALVQKGVLSDQEREDITAKEQESYSQTAISKITLSTAIKSIQFYGDIRLRYEMRDGTTPAGFTGNAGAFSTHGDSETLNRWRYRLRFGIKGDLNDHFFFGLRAATNPYYDRSGNVNFGASDSAGPFGKDRSLLAIDQVYLGWHATDDITLTGGAMQNPLYTTAMVWSEDLNPAGAAEQYDHKFDDNWEVFANVGQFVYQAAAGNGVTNGLGANSTNYNTFMFAEQVGFKYNFDKNTFFKGGATMYNYSGSKGTNTTTVAGLYSTSPINLGTSNASPSFFNGPFVGAASAPVTNVTGINDLSILEVPMEFDFKLGPGHHATSSASDPKDVKSVVTQTTGWEVPVRVFADFAYNFEASERADQARQALSSLAATNTSNVGVTSAGSAAATAHMLSQPAFQGVEDSGKQFLDQAAYEIGIEAGQMKKKGDWDGKVWWQSTGYYALDPNLVDGDIFNATTNMQGVIVAVSHNWTDGLSSTLRYAYAMPVNGHMATPNVNQDLQLGDIRQYNLFQADLMWKF